MRTLARRRRDRPGPGGAGSQPILSGRGTLRPCGPVRLPPRGAPCRASSSARWSWAHGSWSSASHHGRSGTTPSTCGSTGERSGGGSTATRSTTSCGRRRRRGSPIRPSPSWCCCPSRWGTETTATVLLTTVSAVLVVLTTGWIVAPVADRHGWPRWVALGVAVPLAFATEPVRETLGWGQIDLVVAALVLADVGALRRGRPWAGRGDRSGHRDQGDAGAVPRLPGGNAAVAGRRGRLRHVRRHGARRLHGRPVDALLDPAAVADRTASDPHRSERPVAAGPPGPLAGRRPAEPRAVAALAVAVLVGGLGRAVRLSRRGDDLAGVTVTGLTACLISPISWVHHLYWVLPAVVVLVDIAAGTPVAATRAGRRPEAVRWAAAAAALVVTGAFACSLIWFFTLARPSPWTVAGENAYVFLMLGLVAALPAREAPDRSQRVLSVAGATSETAVADVRGGLHGDRRAERARCPPELARLPPPVLDVVVPVHNEEAGLESCLRRLHAHLAAAFPYSVPDHRRRQRQHRRDGGGGPPGRRRTARHRRPGPARAGPRPGAADGVAGLRRAGAGVHGRRPLHRPGRAAPAGRPADLRALRPGDRHPAARGPPGWSAGRSGRSSRAATTCCCAARGTTSVLRRPVRVQGDPGRRGRVAAAAGEDDGWFFDTELLGWPSASGCASTRSRSTGSTTPTAGWTSAPPRWPTWPASSGCCRALHADGCPVAELRAQLGRGPLDPGTPGVPPGSTGQLVALRGDRRAVRTLAYLVLFLLLRAAWDRAGGQSGRAADHHRRQHRGQPPAGPSG